MDIGNAEDPRSMEYLTNMLIKDVDFDIVLDIDGADDQDTSVACQSCSRTFQTLRGLKRHLNYCKGDLFAISSEHIGILIEKGRAKIATDSCFPLQFREKLNNVELFSKEEIAAFRVSIKPIFAGFKGDPEFLYRKFHEYSFSANIISNLLGKRLGSLLLTELCTNCINFLSNSDAVALEVKEFTEREIGGLQYLAGHVYHKFYCKLRWGKKQVAFKQHKLSILTAAKASDDAPQPLIDTLNRGGLWKMNSYVIDIFKFTEGLFRIEIGKGGTKIDDKQLTSSVVSNPTIISYYKNIYANVEPAVPTEAAIDLLEQLVGLHIRIRCHWYARGIKEKHQSEKKETRKKSLRTELKMMSNANYEDN